MWAAQVKAAKDIPLKTDEPHRWGRGGGLNSGGPVDMVIPEGELITITHGKNEKYALWGFGGWIWDLPEEYVGEIIHVYSKS